MSGPLEGIRVIDCSQWLQGALAGAMLGDMGAEVIKVEERVGGDPARGFVRIVATQVVQASRRNYIFEYCNRNKRGMTLDLGKEKGKGIIYRLVKKADIFLHNWRLGVPQRLGMDYETLSRINPGLVYCQASGWGAKGPVSGQPAFEKVAQGRAGMMYCVGEPGMPPLFFASGLGDNIGGTVVVVSVLAALRSRERTGEGQQVDVSLLGSLLHIESAQICSLTIDGLEFPRRARANMGNPLYNHYQCADGKWINLAMMQGDRYWSAFCKTMGIEHLQKDPRFESLVVRSANAEELIRLLDQVFATRTREEWMKIFEEAGLIYGPIQTISEVVNDPQVLENEYIIDFDHPSFGRVKVVGFPYKFSKTPASLRRAAPEFGQHTEEILLEIGYTWDEIARFREEEVI